MQHAMITAVNQLMWITELACHNVNIRLRFTRTGLIGLFRFFVLIVGFTAEPYVLYCAYSDLFSV